MRFWAKEYKDNHIICEITVENSDPELTRTKKVFLLLEEVCHTWDLAVPVWFDSTINDFKYHSKARFYPDNFTETVSFDFMEIQIIEE